MNVLHANKIVPGQIFTRVLVVAGIGVVIWMAWQQFAKEAVLPDPTPVAEGKLYGSESVVINLPLIAETSTRFLVASPGTSLAIDLLDPNANLLSSQSDPLADHAPMRILVTAKESGVYTIRIRKLKNDQAEVSFNILSQNLSGPDSILKRARIAGNLTSQANSDYYHGIVGSQKTRATNLHNAQRHYLMASRAWHKAGKSAEEALEAYKSAIVTHELGQVENALDGFNYAIKLLQNLELKAWAYTSKGSALMRMGRTEESRKALQAGLKLSSSTDSKFSRVRASLQNYLGLTFHSENRLDKAKDWYDLAIDSAKNAGDTSQIAMTQNNLGGIHYVNDEATAALDAFESSLINNRAIGDTTGEIAALGNIGSLQLRTGEFDKALIAFDRIAKLANENSMPQEIARNQQRQGDSYKNLGDIETARRLYSDALKNLVNHADMPLTASITASLAQIEWLSENPQLSLSLSLQAVNLYRKNKQPLGQAKSLLGAAQAAIGLSRIEEAMSYIGAIDTLELGKAKERYQSIALQYSGMALAEKSASSRSTDSRVRKLLHQAIKGHRSVNNVTGEIETLEFLAKYLLANDHAEEASQFAQQALSKLDSSRRQISVAELRARFLGSQMKVYDVAIESRMRLHHQEPNAEHHIEALRIREQAQARVLKDELAINQRSTKSLKSKDLDEKRQSLQRDLNARITRLEKEYEPNLGSDEKVQNLRTQLDAIDAKIGSVDTSSGAKIDPYELAIALEDDQLILVYWLGERRSYCWALTNSGVDVFEILSHKNLERSVMQTMRTLAGAQLNGTTKELKDLSEILLGPVAHLIEDRHIAIVPDSILYLVPFGALRAPNSNNYLIEIAELQILPSLALLQNDSTVKFSQYSSIAIVADPVYSRTDERITAGIPNEENKVSRQQASGVLGNLNRLPFTAQEAKNVVSHFQVSQVTNLVGFNATRAAVMSGSLRGKDIVHFAVHGEANQSIPELSSLKLGAFDQSGNEIDGHFFANDIANLNLDAQLVVISACQTAIGPLIRGEGFLSLSRAFLRQGSNQVVATLWPVSDRSSVVLVTQFYKALIDEQMTPAAALRFAQRSVRDYPKWEDPYFWAGFVLIGWET